MAISRSSHPIQVRLYRAGLHLYPRRFRREYGELMVQTYLDLLHDEGPGVWRRMTTDLLRSVPHQRIEAAMSLQPIHRMLVLSLTAVAAGAAAVFMGGGGVAIVAALLVVGVLVSHRRLLATISLRHRAPLRIAVTQAWWAPVAALLGVATTVTGVATVVAGANLSGRIVGGSLLLAFGLAMLAGLTVRPVARTQGDVMILLATVPAFLFFWVIVPTLAAVVVWIGVLKARPVVGTFDADQPAPLPLVP